MLQKNDSVTVTIEDMSKDGEGIGRADGFTLFVKDAVTGDTVEAKVVKVKKTYGYARMEKVLIPSSQRTKPVCPVYRQCGGCQLQALSYEGQLVFKQQMIRNNLIRIGGFRAEFIDDIMDSIVGMEDPLHYRNKAQYPVGTDREGNIITGFYAGRTHSIIPNTDCHLGEPENARILRIILDYMKENKVTAYDETSGMGLIRHVLIRKGFTGGEIMVCLVINPVNRKKGGKIKEYLPKQQALVDRLVSVEGMTSISVSINTENTNVIMGNEIRTIWGKPAITDTIHVRDMQKEDFPHTGEELRFSISPLSFYQVNPLQTEKLYSLALEYAGLTGKETVWDLYCGIGTISLFLAKHAGRVYGVEVVEQAIRDAKENAARNGIGNAEFLVGKVEEILPEFYDRTFGSELAAGTRPDVIVVDPPRKGCDRVCLDTMLKMRPERIVYVSCDSATLARDLRILCDGGYELKRVRGVDLFPQTVHVESVCLLVNHKKRICM